MNTPDPEATLSGALALAGDEWDDDTLASLRQDDPAPTTLELVAIPGYTQSAWDRKAVEWLRRAEACEDYLWANLDKPDDLLVYDLLLMLGFPNAAAAHMSPAGSLVATAADEGTLYAELLKPAPKAPAKPRRRRPSQARKTITGGKP